MRLNIRRILDKFSSNLRLLQIYYKTRTDLQGQSPVFEHVDTLSILHQNFHGSLPLQWWPLRLRAHSGHHDHQSHQLQVSCEFLTLVIMPLYIQAEETFYFTRERKVKGKAREMKTSISNRRS